MTEEKALQARILRYLSERPNTFVFKVIQANVNGIPDIIACVNGSFLAIEVKSETGKVTPLQEHTLKLLKNVKAITFVARPSNWHELINKIGEL